jgi:hypothetical protein
VCFSCSRASYLHSSSCCAWAQPSSIYCSNQWLNTRGRVHTCNTLQVSFAHTLLYISLRHYILFQLWQSSQSSGHANKSWFLSWRISLDRSRTSLLQVDQEQHQNGFDFNSVHGMLFLVMKPPGPAASTQARQRMQSPFGEISCVDSWCDAALITRRVPRQMRSAMKTASCLWHMVDSSQKLDTSAYTQYSIPSKFWVHRGTQGFQVGEVVSLYSRFWQLSRLC